jgi:hypothetical protein
MTDIEEQWTKWQEPDEEMLTALTRIGTLGADRWVLDSMSRGDTGAEQTRVAVREALRVLLANGLITPTPFGDDFYITLDRP